MKLLKNTIELYLCTFNVTIPLFTSKKEVSYFLKHNDVEDEESLLELFDDSLGNFCSMRQVDGITQIFACFCSDKVSLLVHELHHVERFVSEVLGINCIEAQAYMMQSLYEQAIDELGFSIVRKKK